jgi:uncharacterized protein (DUF3820 family)
METFILDSSVLAKLQQTQMPFGKYKNRDLLDLPMHYLDWFARVGYPEGELGKQIALAHEIKLQGLEYLLKK